MPFIPPFDFHEHVLGPWAPGLAGDAGWTVLMGALVAIACGWLGCYLILQGLSLIGDAISHTVLLGIVVAFLITGQISGFAMFFGATVTGLLTTSIIEWLHTSSRIKEDAAIGIVFTSLFALGVVLLSTLAGKAHIDTQHVLYGDIALSLLEEVRVGGFSIPAAIFRMALLTSCLLVLMLLFFKELQLVAFDPQLAAVMGLHPRVFRYGLMALLSVTVVNCFSAVGAILVVAMLIAPAATAYLLTSRLPAMFAVSAVVGALSSLIGFHVAYWLSASTGGAMVCTACGLFGTAFLFSPKDGLVATALRRLRLRWRMHEENVVRALLKLGGAEQVAAIPDESVLRLLRLSRLKLSWIAFRLRRRGWIDGTTDSARAMRLTRRGAAEAARLDRAHRLWETFLVDQVGIASDHVHPMAEEVEHLLSQQLVENVDDVLGHPDTDPHGAPIPRSPVSDQSPGMFTLSKLRVGDRARVTGIAGVPEPARGAAHAGDSEADNVAGVRLESLTYRQPRAADPAAEIAALGLPLGQPFAVIGRDAGGPSWTIEFPDGRSVDISHRLADAVLVQPEAR